jgi:hypothetical protein
VQKATPIEVAAADDYEFHVGDYTGDGIADLICLKRRDTGSEMVEVHVLSGASEYQLPWAVQKATPIEVAAADDNEFHVAQ